MVYITRKERFNSAHKLYREDWTLEKNLEVFGKCANPNWHGHNYELYVTVKGTPDAMTGFVIDLKVLSEIVNEKITEKLDHKNLNLDVEFMKGKMPSTEILAIEIWKQIAGDIKKNGGQLHCIKVCETDNNYVEYFGD